ncbi:hypothetical protein [Couchioplanes caeruleus]|uniref:Uncharacterized protein n=2 Tax=Couchioplanes caeruleus TaxID=56438 RepID=A0A1K0FDX1_9ACTN|nr:hypothetical protein [Couchioplanes caeruleus]OJF11017.1 hypothetical protein BG844_28980 [Couchioplanes caeruleus subsp. caeruleus]ROP29850.1 hypothetical protein EDD30_2671 [Couchioplanes caeruleus]
MSIASIGSGAALWGHVMAPGAAPDPRAQQEQVNAQADLLQALRGVQAGTVVAAKVTNGTGIDIYM